MKITKFVEFSEEVEVHISEEEIICALAESADSRSMVIQGMNGFAQFTKAISDDLIEEIKPEQREVIANYLREQAVRFQPDDIDMHVELFHGTNEALGRIKLSKLDHIHIT